jgi:hypothetical protein
MSNESSRMPFKIVVLILVFCVNIVHAELLLKVENPKLIAQKVIVPLAMTNNFDIKIESARASVFLIAENGKVMSRSTTWVIGGSKEKPGLAAKMGTTYNFVLPTDKPFKTARISFNRIVLEGGKLAELPKDIEVVK